MYVVPLCALKYCRALPGRLHVQHTAWFTTSFLILHHCICTWHCVWKYCRSLPGRQHVQHSTWCTTSLLILHHCICMWHCVWKYCRPLAGRLHVRHTTWCTTSFLILHQTVDRGGYFLTGRSHCATHVTYNREQIQDLRGVSYFTHTLLERTKNNKEIFWETVTET